MSDNTLAQLEEKILDIVSKHLPKVAETTPNADLCLYALDTALYLQTSRVKEYEAYNAENLNRIELLEAGWQSIIDNKWKYWPPRSGEVHCSYCGRRTWYNEEEEQHDSGCVVLLASSMLKE